MKYTTQMNAARQGIVTKEMEAVAAYEGIDVKDLMAEVAAGTIVIPANKNHKCLKPFGNREFFEDKDQCKPWNIQRLSKLRC